MIFGEWDEEMFVKVQKQISYEEGEEAGAQKNAIANAKNALSMGLSPEQAAQITSLPLEQVLALKEELAHEIAGVAGGV